MHTVTHETRVDRIIMDDSQYSQKQQYPERRVGGGLGAKARHQSGDNRHKERSDQWNEFQQSGDQSENEREGNPKNYEAQGADCSDQQAGCQLGANIRGERAINILKELITTPTPAPTWKHLQRRASKRVDVFEEKERED